MGSLATPVPVQIVLNQNDTFTITAEVPAHEPPMPAGAGRLPPVAGSSGKYASNHSHVFRSAPARFARWHDALFRDKHCRLRRLSPIAGCNHDE